MKDLFTFSPRLLECSSGRSSLTPSFPIPSESLVAEAVGRLPLCWVQLSFSRRHRPSVTWPQFRAARVHLPFLGVALASLMPTRGAFTSLSNWVQGRCDHSQWLERPDLLGIWQQFLCFYKTPQGSKGQLQSCHDARTHDSYLATMGIWGWGAKQRMGKAQKGNARTGKRAVSFVSTLKNLLDCWATVFISKVRVNTADQRSPLCWTPLQRWGGTAESWWQNILGGPGDPDRGSESTRPPSQC